MNRLRLAPSDRRNRRPQPRLWVVDIDGRVVKRWWERHHDDLYGIFGFGSGGEPASWTRGIRRYPRTRANIEPDFKNGKRWYRWEQRIVRKRRRLRKLRWGWA